VASRENNHGKNILKEHSTKGIPEMTESEAAGTAAALSIRQYVPARQVDIKTLQAELRARGGILSEEDIAKANTPTPALAEA
jgi:hypothetical protein